MYGWRGVEGDLFLRLVTRSSSIAAMGREEFEIELTKEPGARETTMHYNKMREFVVSVRPDLEAESKTKRFSIVARNEKGEIVGGAYLYTSIGSMVLEAIWVEPAYRTKGVGLELMLNSFNLSRAEGCAQVIGM